MLTKAIEILRTNDYSMSNVLKRSDFELTNPSKKYKNEQEKETKFYGLSI